MTHMVSALWMDYHHIHACICVNCLGNISIHTNTDFEFGYAIARKFIASTSNAWIIPAQRHVKADLDNVCTVLLDQTVFSVKHIVTTTLFTSVRRQHAITQLGAATDELMMPHV